MDKYHQDPATAQEFSDDVDSCCSTPYVSAPSSPGRAAPRAAFYYSAPASPMHFLLSASSLSSCPSSAAAADDNASFDYDFDFSATMPSTAASSPEHMTSADELFFNGQIRPMKLSTHLQRPQLLDPLIESDDVVEDDRAFPRGRDLKLRAGSLRRRTRSTSPIRSTAAPFDLETGKCKLPNNPEEEKGSSNECASRTSSAGRGSKRWMLLKDFLYRSKSEGRNERHKFWASLFFSHSKDKKIMATLTREAKVMKEGKKREASKRRSPHELHYTAKKAQAEEMRKKTFLPYREGVLGCLGFSWKSYGAVNGGFARAFTAVSSR